jgi:hypothetical protein
MASYSPDKSYSSNERITVDIPNRTFACVEFPGVVNNVDKAVEMLGGVQSIGKVGCI